MSLTQLLHIEERLKKLGRKLPQLPATETLVLRAAMILGRDFNALLERQLKPAGLTEAEFRMLMGLLAYEGHASAGDLCAALAQSPANLTRLSDAVVERGLVSRSPDTADRRRMLLTLQPAGEELIRKMLPQITREVSAAFAGFSTAEKQQLLDGLKRLLAGIDALNAGAEPSQDESA